MKKRLLSILMVCMMLIGTFSTGIASIHVSAASSYGPYKIDIAISAQQNVSNQELVDIIDSYSDEFLLNATGFAVSQSEKLTDVSYVFERMPNLKYFYMHNGFNVSSLDGIENCPLLEEITATNCKIEDIESLRNLTNLRYVNISVNKVKDISPLSNLPNLTSVSLWFNLISDATPLMREKPYNHINLTGNLLTSIDFLDGINLLEEEYELYVSSGTKFMLKPHIDIASNDLSAYDAELANLKATKYNGANQEFIYKQYERFPKSVGTMFCQSQEIDILNKTITITSNVNADFVVLYRYFDDIRFAFDLDRNNIYLPQGVEMYSNYRYKINKPDDSDTFIRENFYVGVTDDDFSSEKYTLIVKFVSKEVSISQDEIRPLYADNAVVDNDAGTITVNSVEGRNYFDLYNIGLNKGVTFSLPEDDCVDLYSAYRYKITKPQNSNQYTSKITVTTKDGTREYDFIANFIEKQISISENEFRMIYTPETPIVDNDAGTITLSAKEGLDYLALYNVGTTNGVTFTIAEDDCVDKYSTYRYKITKPVDSNVYTSKITVTTKDGTRDYDLIVNFTEKPITISASEFRMLYTPETPIVDNTAKTITLTSKAGLDYLALYNVGTTNGVTFIIDEDDCVDKYSTYRYKITKPVDSNVYTSKITVTTKDGSAVYDLIVNFA